MIIYRQWREKKSRHICDGWYLFGVIPLYVRYLNMDIPVLTRK